MSGRGVSAPVVTLSLIALAILSTSGARSAAATGDSTVFQASADFSSTQGSRGWSYRDSTGAPLNYDAANRRWFGSEAYLFLWADGAHPGQSRGALRRWTAPQAGTIRINGIATDIDTRCGDGVTLTIRKNGVYLWQKAFTNGDTTGIAFDLTTSVAANGTIDFLLARGPGTNSCDSTRFDAAIAYGSSTSSTSTTTTPTTTGDSTVFQASADFSSTQGSRGWSYRDSTGAPLNYDAANRWWFGSEAYLFLWADGAHPGQSRGALRRWTAPQAGTIRINGIATDIDTRCGDGVTLTIRKNGVYLWQKAFTNGDTTGIAFDLTTSVAANGTIDFLLARGPGTNSCDSTRFDAAIAYGLTTASTTSTSTTSTSTTSTPTTSTPTTSTPTTSTPTTSTPTTSTPTTSTPTTSTPTTSTPTTSTPTTSTPTTSTPTTSTSTTSTSTTSTSTTSNTSSTAELPPQMAKVLGPVRPKATTEPVERDAWTVIEWNPLTLLMTEQPVDADPDAYPAYGWGGPSFYDRAYWCYGMAVATGSADVLDRCRFYAQAVAEQPRLRVGVEQYVRTGDYETYRIRPSGRDLPVLGLAAAAFDTRDPQTAAIAKRGLARAAFDALNWASFSDPRESGYSLMALVFAHAAGVDANPRVMVADLPPEWGEPWTVTRARNFNTALEAKKSLDAALGTQQTWGCWNSTSAFEAPAGTTPIYMQGIALEGLIAYDTFIGDPRILPAVLECLTWLNSNYQPTAPANYDNRFGLGGWWYSAIYGDVPHNAAVYPTLSMVLLNPIAWAYAKTGDEQWRTLGEQAFAASVEDNVAGSGNRGSKEANQFGRGLFRWLGVR